MPRLNAYRLRKWSVQVRWRDRVCQVCGSREELEAHHLNSKSYFPEQAYDLDNGIALCGNYKKTGQDCHTRFHAMFMQGHRKKCTTKDWTRFIETIKWAQTFMTRAMEGPDD